ncbi:MAG: DUF5668 domain-containing protein [bacterium]|nr:DUF5668 domain-containing protein [bacterium]MDE0290764.1 DUF5668 domain-containing protein [bacterium]MDE0440068.1 DUF5668 domain-containing protein [bacterium]
MSGSGPRTRVWIGLVLVVLGAMFLVDNLTDWHFPRETLWPVILIAFGVVNLVRRGSGRWIGVILTLLGIVFLLDALDIVTFHMRDVWRLWPLVLLFIGVRMLLGTRRRRRRRPQGRDRPTASQSDHLGATYLFCSGVQRITNRSFSEGEATAVFGSARIDLRDASLAQGGGTIDVTALFGTVELRVPEGWAIDVQTTQFLGGVEDKRTRSAQSGSGEELTITGICMFGSLIIDS